LLLGSMMAGRFILGVGELRVPPAGVVTGS
jgi:hypothetical protein